MRSISRGACVLLIYENTAYGWFMFQNMGPSPSGRFGHAMASSGTRELVLGGEYATEP
jgi:hypothetical protein